MGAPGFTRGVAEWGGRVSWGAAHLAGGRRKSLRKGRA